MNNKVISVLIFMWFGPIHFMGQTTFNDRFGDINYEDSIIYSFDVCRSVSVLDSMIFVTRLQQWEGQNLKLGCIGINYEGDEIFSTLYGSEDAWWYAGSTSSSFLTSDSCIIEVGSIDYIGTSSLYPSIYKFDQNGDTLWTKEYPVLENRISYGQQIIETSNGDYLMVARAITDTIDWDRQILLIQTNSDGELTWFQEYGNSELFDEYGVSVIEVQGGYLVGGQFLSSPFSNNFVMKIDELGNQEWFEQYGSTQFNDGSVQLNNLSDGSYLLSGSTGVDDNQFKAALRKIDSNGDIIWENEYGKASSFGAFLSTIEDWDNNIVTVGETLDSTGWRVGTMAKINLEGDSIWMREYRLFESNTIHHLFDIGLASDNSYVAAGWELTIPPNPHVGQDVWVFKVDEHGCLEPGCHLINGLESINIGLQNSMEVYPNPVKDQLNIQFNLPPSGSFGDQKNNQLLILNPVGQIVLEETLNMFRNHESFTTELNLSHLAPGHYTLHWLSNRGWLDSVTILKH